jgi:ABC-2 type transport system ATP-binding protein
MLRFEYMSAALGEVRMHPPYRSPPATEPAKSEAPIIECEEIVHSFGSKEVLRGVSFEVAKGSIYGFIGANGAGKTTTLRILATLLEPTAGTALVAGHDVIAHPERARRILGYMPDGPGVNERVTVFEYLDFFASAHGIYREARARAVATVVDLTEIGPLRSTHVTTLSKGQKQRLLLARTLLHDPLVLILDEPASDLDPRARIELRTLLGRLGRMGKTILLSSHILTELAELCDSIGVLEGGRIVVSGSIEEVSAKVRPCPRLRLTVLGGQDTALDLLRTSPLVKSVAVQEQREGATMFEVTYDGDPRTVADLVSDLSQARIAVCRVEPERMNLERLFMDVTDKAGRSEVVALDGSSGREGASE